MVHRLAELSGEVVAELQGRVIKTIGDAVMAEFPEPALAVRTAVELQRRLLALNRKLPERERLQLRIGINHGTAIRYGGDVYGDAVNLAARITKRTGPAQILISRAVREGIGEDAELRCTWLGEVTVEGKAGKEHIYEVVWTDTATYTDLRTDLAGRLRSRRDRRARPHPGRPSAAPRAGLPRAGGTLAKGREDLPRRSRPGAEPARCVRQRSLWWGTSPCGRKSSRY